MIRLRLLALCAYTLWGVTFAPAQSTYEPYLFTTFVGNPPGSRDGTGTDASQAQTANISTRGEVDTGDNVLIGGFIIPQGAIPDVLIRAIGPELSGQGITNPLQDTTLELHDLNGALLAFNGNWESDQKQEIMDTGIPPTDPREAAILSTLSGGSYTAVVRGKDTLTGIANVQVYVLQ